GETDIHGKESWANYRGAIFLANIGDTNCRCSGQASRNPPSNEALAACNDASDNVQRAPHNMAPLRTVPLENITNSAIGFVSIPNPEQRPFVRIFHQRGDRWAFVQTSYSFSTEELRGGLVLGIDARDIRRPGGWDGRITVRFTVHDCDQVSTDEVMLRVAPILTHHHLQNVQQVLSVRGNDTLSPWQKLFTESLSAAVEATGLTELLCLFNGSDDIWAQDFVEPGYTSMPGPDGPISIRIMVRSGQDSRVAGRQVFEHLRNTGVGAIQQLGGARDEINSMGNLECIPPYAHNGTRYPSGRIIMGRHGPYLPHMLDFFRAQSAQDPILLDTSWLWVGHVDEFVQFLPAKTERGWAIMVADPEAGINILRETKAAGHGGTRLYSRKPAPQFPGANCTSAMYSCVAMPVSNSTIDQALSNEELIATNMKCKMRIEANINILKEATGITDAEIYRAPALFNQLDVEKLPWIGPRDPNEKLSVGSAWPGVINGVVLTGYGTYVAPNPWGPNINGLDVVAEATKEEYAKLGLNVNFVDDWNSHHKYGGEVHCGTNTVRQMDQPWWST
ncbi:arginine deiminase type-3, partial [Pyrenochaeta sp. MPI-SDFR-AT-0127]